MEASVMLIPPVKQVIGALIFVYGKPTQRYCPGVFLNFKLHDIRGLCVDAPLKSETNATAATRLKFSLNVWSSH